MREEQCDIFGADVAVALAASGRTSLARLSRTDHLTILRGALHLDGGGLNAPYAPLVTISIPWRVTEMIPRVTCHEPWLIDGGVEWHRYSNGSLCFELPMRWRDHVMLVASVYGERAACTYAAEYLLNSVQWLLDRHRFGYYEGLTHWPESWPGWPHGVPHALFAYKYQRAA